MAKLTIQEAQAQLADLIHRLAPGEEVVVTENNLPVAKLGVCPQSHVRWPSKAVVPPNRTETTASEGHRTKGNAVSVQAQ